MNGKQYRDVVTGFEGTCTGVVDYLTGCRQYLLVGKASDGKEAAASWFDEDRCEALDSAPVRISRHTRNGFDQAAPIR